MCLCYQRESQTLYDRTTDSAVISFIAITRLNLTVDQIAMLVSVNRRLMQAKSGSAQFRISLDQIRTATAQIVPEQLSLFGF